MLGGIQDKKKSKQVKKKQAESERGLLDPSKLDGRVGKGISGGGKR